MSTIHKALKKAQRERESLFREHTDILSGRKEPIRRAHPSWIWWLSPPIVASLLAFATYSWFHTHPKQLTPMQESSGQKPMGSPVAKKMTPPPPAEETPGKSHTAHAQDLYEKAKVLHKKGTRAEAKRLYAAAIESNPGHLDALNNLGVLFIGEQAYEAAKDVLVRATRMAPAYVDAYYNLACVYALTGDAPRAVAHLKEAYAINPEVKKWAANDADLENLRGNAAFQAFIK